MKSPLFAVLIPAAIAVTFPSPFVLGVPQAAEAGDPLAASAGARWTQAEAAHLLRRAGFGGTPEQIHHLVRLGRDAAVDSLVDYEVTVQDDPDFPEEAFMGELPRRFLADLTQQERMQLLNVARGAGRELGEAMQDWWLRRMVVTPRPLEEKMTLFWHGHFTSGLREVRRPGFMMQQNAFLREHAMGGFETLVKGISRDPAMLTYLDNASNVKANPNENYARELLELFTMGEGNYTEQDVREAARAFTGWTAAGAGQKRPRGRDEQPDASGFVIRMRQHDDGEKTFLGRTGNFDGDDVIDIILEQPATARFLARKLWAFFVEPEPDAALIDALAERLRTDRYDIRETMRAMLRSDAFYAQQARFSLIKSPTELMVSTMRLLDAPPGDVRAANRNMAEMGQELFQPPNVRGWVGGRTWISTSTLFVRYNAVADVVYGSEGAGAKRQLAARRAIAELAAADGEEMEEMEEQMQMEMEREPRGRARRPGAGKPGTRPAGGRDRPGAMREQRARLASVIDKLPEEAREWLAGLDDLPQFSGPQSAYDPADALRKYRLRTADGLVDHYAQRLLQMSLPRERKAELVAFVELGTETFNENAPDAPDRVRRLVHLILSMPEYQLN